MAQKKAAIVRKMEGMPSNAVWLFVDETVLRLLPELRRAWSLLGKQARIAITGENAKCVLLGALNPRTGHRIVARGPNMRQQHFQRFLRRLRRAYPGRPIWLILDKASCHTAPRSQALTHLDVRTLTSLEYLDCSYNGLCELPLDGLTELQGLDADSNLLASLNVRHIKSLRVLYCASNQLTALDFSGLDLLQILDCSSNSLASLKLDGCSSLQDFKRPDNF